MKTARLAGFATRVLAFAVDLLIIDVAALAFGGALAWAANVLGVELNPSGPVIAGLAAVGWIVLLSTYLVVFWCLTGQTPGMRFMGIRVTDRRGAPPGFVRSLRRLVGMYLSAIPFGAGFLLILVDDRRRGLHDRIAGTLVTHYAPADAVAGLEPVGSSASDDALRSPGGLA
jgi:uncharacterized RDD family membrane protein YckC